MDLVYRNLRYDILFIAVGALSSQRNIRAGLKKGG